jgi:TPR repeat protein
MKRRYVRAIRTLFAGLVASATMIGVAVAGPFEDGLAAAQKGDYSTALRLWRSLAGRGDADAQYNLGVMYNNGDGVAKNYTEALKWHRRAAAQGNGNAQFNLGLMCDHGRGMTQNYTEAAKWYHLAAARGVAVAQYKLGTMYHDGQGVPRDFVQAYMWFEVAAAQFPASDNEDRDDANDARDLVASKMSQAEIAKAQELARQWKLVPNH